MRSLIAVLAAALILPSIGCSTMSGTQRQSIVSWGKPGQARPAVQQASFAQQNQVKQCQCLGACDCGDACEIGDGCCTGCGSDDCGSGGLCSRCLSGLRDRMRNDSDYAFNQGPATAQVAYPYYSVRGPRDFLMKNPPSIGPGGYSPNCPY